jgi:hypothetical protein
MSLSSNFLSHSTIMLTLLAPKGQLEETRQGNKQLTR